MRYLSLLGVSVAVSLPACASIYNLQYDLNSGPSRLRIVKLIRCQLYEALYGEFTEPSEKVTNINYEQLDGWAAVFSLTLKEANSNNQNGSVGVVIPIDVGNFPINGSSTASLKDTRTGTTEFSVQFSHLPNDIDVNECSGLGRGSLPLYGDLRFQEEFLKLSEVIEATGFQPIKKGTSKEANSKKKYNIKSHSYTIEFELKRSTEFEPKFALIPIGDSTIGGGYKFGWERIADYKLQVSLAPVAEEKTTKVVILEDRTKFADDGRTETTQITVTTPDPIQDATEALTREILRGISVD